MTEIYLYGEIGDVGLTAADIKSQINAADPAEELLIRIDSPGGSVFQAFSIFQSIRDFRGPTRAVIESSAFSAASYIAAACDVVEIVDNGYMMLHNPSMLTDGDHDAHARDAKMLGQVRESMVSGYARKSGIPRKRVMELMEAETYFDANESVREGFADVVLPGGVESRVAFASGTPGMVVARVTRGRTRRPAVTAKRRWDAAVSEARGQGLRGVTAVQAANRANPGLRQSVVREANPDQRRGQTRAAAPDGDWDLWQGLMQHYQAKGLSFSKAVAKVEEQDPGLRERAVAARNRVRVVR